MCMKRHATLADGLRHVRNLIQQEKVNFGDVQNAFFDVRDQFPELMKKSKPMAVVPKEVHEVIQQGLLQRGFKLGRTGS